jgi:hypothetical protein
VVSSTNAFHLDGLVDSLCQWDIQSIRLHSSEEGTYLEVPPHMILHLLEEDHNRNVPNYVRALTYLGECTLNDSETTNGVSYK